MNFNDFWPQDRLPNDPRQAQDGSKRLLKAYVFYVEFCVRFWSVFGSILDPFGRPFGHQNLSQIGPKIYQKSNCASIVPWNRSKRAQDRSKRCQDLPKRLQDRPKSPQRLPKRPSETPPTQEQPRGSGRSHLFPKIFFFSNVLNKLNFFIKICIGSFQEAIKKIQELPKLKTTKTAEPLSLWASKSPRRVPRSANYLTVDYRIPT